MNNLHAAGSSLRSSAKRLTALALCFLLMISMVPAHAFAKPQAGAGEDSAGLAMGTSGEALDGASGDAPDNALEDEAKGADASATESESAQEDDSGESISGNGTAGASESSVPSGAENASGDADKKQAHDEVIIVYKENAENIAVPLGLNEEGEGTRSSTDRKLKELDVRVTEEIASSVGGDGAAVLAELPETLSVDEAILELSAQPDVAYVQPNYRYKLVEPRDGEEYESLGPAGQAQPFANGISSLPNDPACNNGTSSANQYYLFAAKAVNAWAEATCGGSVTVAVLDTGCRLDHEDLVGVVDAAHAYDAYSNRPLSQSGYGDYAGHGTHVCGIVSGQANNGVGIAGASYNANLLPVKVFDDSTSSQTASASTATMLKAYEYLGDLIDAGSVPNLRVINMSLGYYSNSIDAAFQAAIKSMRSDHGVLTVCAGGNGDANGNPRTDASYPSDFDECLSVTSLDRDGGNTYWSDYNAAKDISASGVDICSTYKSSNTSYARLSGTSMAAPLVSGIAALLWAVNPDLSVDDVVAAIKDTADPIVDNENDRRTTSGSAGAVNAQAAVESVMPANPATQANLVLLVRFAGDTVGDGETGYNAPYPFAAAGVKTQWEYLMKGMNAIDVNSNTFRGYVRTISNGQCNVESVFPQTQPEGTVAYITLDRELSYYQDDALGDHRLLTDTIQKFNEAYPDFDTSLVDLDKDGTVDNLLLIPAVPMTGSFTSHEAFSVDRITVGTAPGQTAELGSYNVIESRSSVSSGGLFNTFFVGTATHEFLHTLDARDLYRGGNATGNPVGIWDVMAASDAMSWPLAVTREDIGWYTIPDKENEGTYTLCAPGDVDASVGKDNAIAIRSPLSDSEYFVVEYRQQGQTISALDRNIGGSGLVVYRVNPAYAAEGNIRGNDYVYVFRQNETGISDSAGDILTAQVGTSAYGAPRQTIGSLAMEDGITTGALCYSNGRNSGLKIDVTEQTNGSITFSVTHADYTSMDLWRDAKDASGAALPTGENVSDTQVVAGEDALYCLTQSSGDVPLLHVWKYTDGVWADCGQVASGLSRARMEWHAGSLYVAASDYRSNRMVLKRFENGAWQEKAHIGKAANDVRMSSVNGVLYVLADDMSSAHAQVYAYSDGTLSPLGGELPVGYMAHPAIFEVNGAPAVACGDLGSDFRGTELKVFRYQDNAWAATATLTDGCPVTLDSVSGIDGAYLFCSYQDRTFETDAPLPRLLKIDDSGVIAAMRELSALPQYVLDASISTDDAFLYVGIVGQDGVAEVYSVACAGNGDASALGQAVYSPAMTIDSAIVNGAVYCGVSSDVPGNAYVKTHAALGSADARITISYVSSDAAMGTVNRASEQVAALTGAPLGATANAATGYHFVNWTDASGAVVSRSAVFKPSKNPQTQAYTTETYKANFAANAYKVSFNANGGAGIMSSQSMTYGRAAALSPNRFVRNGYAFLGWSRSISAVAAQYKDGQIVTNLTSGDGATVALYAVWRKEVVAKTSRTLAGNTLFDTSAAQVKAAYSSSTKAILVGNNGWQDALSGAGLAGALDCPIVFTEKNALNGTTKTLLSDLGVKQVVVIGGTSVVSDRVLNELSRLGVSSVRIWGMRSYDTQMEVYSYGERRGLWGRDTVIVATGTGFADALSVAPVAFVKKAPIFLVDGSKELTQRQKDALSVATKNGKFVQALVIGGTGAVSNSVDSSLSGYSQSCMRLAGLTLYDTSSEVAEWAADTGLLAWDGVAFATGSGPYDALSGSVLQGKTRSVLLLVKNPSSPTVDRASSHKETIANVTFFGGEVVMPPATKRAILQRLGF